MSREIQPSVHFALAQELRGRFALGDVVIGQPIDLGGERFWIEGFDPIGAESRQVYLRASRGERFAIDVPSR